MFAVRPIFTNPHRPQCACVLPDAPGNGQILERVSRVMRQWTGECELQSYRRKPTQAFVTLNSLSCWASYFTRALIALYRQLGQANGAMRCTALSCP
jgi:hypothetical protein